MKADSKKNLLKIMYIVQRQHDRLEETPPKPPPVKEPPNQPGQPPVKEPPPNDPDRSPPKPPVKAALDAVTGWC